MALTFEPQEVARRSQTLITQAVGRGCQQLAERIAHYTGLAREVGGMLRERGEPQTATLLESAAGRADDIARYLRSTDPTAIWNDAQVFARDRTWVLAGAGLVGGVALARAVRTAVSTQDGRQEPDYVDAYGQPQSTPPAP